MRKATMQVMKRKAMQNPWHFTKFIKDRRTIEAKSNFITKTIKKQRSHPWTMMHDEKSYRRTQQATQQTRTKLDKQGWKWLQLVRDFRLCNRLQNFKNEKQSNKGIWRKNWISAGADPGGSYWGDRPIKTYESNFIHHHFG